MSKGKKPKGGPSDTVNYEGLLKEQLNAGKWQSFIIFVVPNSASSMPLVQLLLSAIESKCRRKFTFMTKDSIIASAKEDAKLLSATAGGGGGRKSKQSTSVSKPLYAEVCQHVVNALASNELSPTLISRLLKYLVLKKRTDDLSSLADMPQKETEEKLPKGASAKAKGGDRTSKKGKVTPATDVEKFPMPEKLPTTMKKRGDELESQYIDDEPPTGPSCYVVLSGFHEIDILHHLCEVGMPVNVLFKISNVAPNENFDSEGEPNEENDLQQSEIVQFWAKISQVISASPSGSLLRDMALLNYECSFDSENKDFGMHIFNDLANQVYEILKYHQQYKHYLNYLDVKELPLMTIPQKESIHSHVCDIQKHNMNIPLIDMRYYIDKLDQLPQETIGPSLIIESMLDQVDLLIPNSHNQLEMNTSITTNFNDIFHNALEGMQSNDENTSEAPVLHSHNQNEIAHIRNSDFPLSRNHLSLLNVFAPPVLPASLNLSYHKQYCALKQFTDKIPQLQIKSFLSMLLSLLSLEYMPPPTSNQEPPVDLTANISSLLFDHPFDIPLSKDYQEPGNAAVVSIDSDSSVASSTKYSLSLPEKCVDLSEYKVLEPLDQNVLLQVIQRYMSTHPYIHLYHQKLTGNLVVAMYSGFHEIPGKYQWQKHVHSRVGFNNFLSHISELVGEAVTAAAEEESQLRKDLEAQQAEMILKAKQEATTPTPQPDSKSSSAKSGKKSAASSATKKGSKPPPSSATKDKESIDTGGVHVELPIKKLYTGYSVGDKVLLVNGTVGTAFTYDGICISVEEISFIDEPKSLSVKVLHNDILLSACFTFKSTIINELSEKEANENISANPLPQTPNSISFSAFKATLGDSLTLSVSYYGSCGNGQLPSHPKSEIELRKLEQSRPESSQSSRPSSQDKKLSKKQQEEQQRLQEQQHALDMKNKEILLQKILAEEKSIHSANTHQKLCLTTSQGLHIKFSTIASDAIDQPSSTVIHQEFTKSTKFLPNETFRLYLDDGSVIRKMSNGSMKILCHDGKLFDSCSKVLTKQSTPDTSSTNKVSFIDIQDSSDDLETWLVTMPDGKRQVWRYIRNNKEEEETEDKNDQLSEERPDTVLEYEDLDPIRSYSIVDPNTQEVLLTREDNVMILKKVDGSIIVDHADGTKITSSPSSFFKFEHPFFATTSFNSPQCTVKLSTATVTTSSNGHFTVSNNINNYNLNISPDGEVTYSLDQSSYTIYHSYTNELLLAATDSYGVKYNVSSSGEIQQVNNEVNKMPPIPSTFRPHFFLIEEDGNGYEIHDNAYFKELMDKAKSTEEIHVIEEEFIKGCSTILVSPITNDKTPVYQDRDIVPQTFRATPDTHSFNRKSFGVKVGRSQSTLKSESPISHIEDPIAFTYREFIRPKEESFTLQEAFMLSLSKYLEWRQQSQKESFDALPLQINDSSHSMRSSPLSSKSLLKFYKELWNKRNGSLIPTLPQSKSSSNASAKKDINSSKIKHDIINRNFLPYFQSSIGQEFLLSITNESESSSAVPVSGLPDDLPSITIDYVPLDEELTVTTNEVEQPTLVQDIHATQKKNIIQSTAFQVVPQYLDFGIIKEGCIYTVKCTLRNNGISTSHFTINSPPPTSGIRVAYTAGFVIAGTSIDFDVEIFALASTSSTNQKRMIYHELDISTAIGSVSLPIKACIYSSSLFDQYYTHVMSGTMPMVTSFHVCK